MSLTKEDFYIAGRLYKAGIQSLAFYMNRLRPIEHRKIVFTTIEGTCGYMCNPKYIAEEFIRQGLDKEYKLVWLVNDISKEFPKQIWVVKNTLRNRARELSTAGIWIDNSRKQLEVRKREGQVYIQTWHAKLGFKPTCLDRGVSFTKIAYLVSRHDSEMVDYWLSNSDWYDDTLERGSLYVGKTLRTGSPRCDVLVKAREDKKYQSIIKQKIIDRYIGKSDRYPDEIHFIMYAPTFRGGSQKTDRTISVGAGSLDYSCVVDSLEKRFGGKWYVLLRLHPQLSARHMTSSEKNDFIIDVSRVDDMYWMLAGCEAFLTDYSSAAFDAAVMKMPIFLYCDDYAEYENERGSLLWDLRKLPFPMAENMGELKKSIREFDENSYRKNLEGLIMDTGMKEPGDASTKVVDFILSLEHVKMGRGKYGNGCAS